MRVYSKAVGHWDATSKRYVLDESQSVFVDGYTGPVVSLKESAQEKQNRIALENAQTGAINNYYTSTLPWEQNMYQKQMDLYTQQAAQQKQFQDTYLNQQQQQYKQYMDLMTQAYQKQAGIQDQVTAAMTPYLSGEKGFTPGQMTTMNTMGMQNLASGYSDASAALKAQLLARGGTSGDQPLSGLDIGSMAELQSNMANNRATLYNTNQLANYQQALENAFRGASAMMGVAGQQGQTGATTGSLSSGSLAGYGSMANNYAVNPNIAMPGLPQTTVNPNTKGPSFWDTLTQGVASGFGSSLGGAMTGGIGTGLSMVGSGAWGF